MGQHHPSTVVEAQMTHLVRDMIPVVLAAKTLEVFLQQSSHLDDAVSHALNLTQPLLVQGRVVEDLRSNARTMNWRIRVEWSNQDLDLRVDPLLLLSRLTTDRESSYTLSVQTLGRRVSMLWYLYRQD